MAWACCGVCLACLFKLQNLMTFFVVTGQFLATYLLGSGFLTSIFALDICITVLAILLIHKVIVPIIRSYNHTKLLDEILGTDQEKHWFFGHSKKYPPSSTKGLDAFNRDIYPNLPGSLNFWTSPFSSLPLLYHPETVSPILSSNAPKSELTRRLLRPWLGESLVIANGDVWKRRRKMLTPAFHFKILQQYVVKFNSCCQVMMDKFDTLCSEPIEVEKHVKLLALDAIMQCAMSSETDCQTSGKTNEYINATEQINRLMAKRFTNPILLVDFIFDLTADGKQYNKAIETAHKTATKIIENRRLEKKNQSSEEDFDNESAGGKKSKKLRDFIDILLEEKDEHGVGLTDSEIREEVDTFLFAGHDTLTSAISFLLYNLANNQDVQKRCRNEVDNVLAGKPEVEWGDIAHFEYLSMVIKESLRLHNPVLSIGRNLEKPYIIKSNIMKKMETVLPKKMDVNVHLAALSGNPHVWENPKEFNPERFTKEAISKRSPHAFAPFSAGPRNCIGQQFALSEIKVVAAQLLRRFHLSINENSPKMVDLPSAIRKSENGIYIKFTPL